MAGERHPRLIVFGDSTSDKSVINWVWLAHAARQDVHKHRNAPYWAQLIAGQLAAMIDTPSPADKSAS